MNELQKYIDMAKPSMSSREIAELTGKRHDNVLRDIENMIVELKGDLETSNLRSAIKSSTYRIEGQQREYPQYDLDFDSTMCLVAGYSAVLRMRIIKRWRELESDPMACMPPYLRRVVLNFGRVPVGYFSMLNEIQVLLIGPMEAQGFKFPGNKLPDGSEGKMFSNWLREQHIDPTLFPKYSHLFEDGRQVEARAYPEAHLGSFRKHFREVWINQHATRYFHTAMPIALPYFEKFKMLGYST